MRVHRKVWLWIGRGWALQRYVSSYVSLGIHWDYGRGVLDLHLGRFILALGPHPELTPYADRARASCRGFLIDQPVL